jgi:hypothetical protein
MLHKGGFFKVKFNPLKEKPIKNQRVIVKQSLFLGPLRKEILTGVILTLLSTTFLSAQTRTLRIVNYNIEDDTDGNTTPLPGLIAPVNNTSDYVAGGVLEGIGEEIINGDPAQPIDILGLEETTSNPTTVQPIVNALNSFYSVYNYLYPIPAGYAMSPYQATEEGNSPTDGNGPNALVYNTNTLQLLASVGIATPTGGVPSGNGMYRQCVRYEFAPAGVTATTNNEFYVYVSHYKASSGSTDDADRLGEAIIIRNDEAVNCPNDRALYVGDYNPDDNSGEPGYQTICSNTAPNGVKQGWGIDPLNTNASPNINWSSSTSNPQILFMLSEEDYELRYRDDLQVMTSNVYFRVTGGMRYVPGTYHSFANNGTTAWGNSVDLTGNTALNDLDTVKTNATGLTASSVLLDLTDASDHLPIVSDYTIPIPAPVIASIGLTGNNVAFNVADGMTNGIYTVLMTTNILLPPSKWVPVATNTSPGGNFTITVANSFNIASPTCFYLLQTH